MKKEVECPHVASSKDGGYYYELHDVNFDFCKKCNSLLLNKMKEQEALEKSFKMEKPKKPTKKKKKKQAKK